MAPAPTLGDAPRDLVWKAWSEPARLQEWWGPKGCKVEIKKLEFRPGGFFHYVMGYSSGAEMWGRFMYREIEAPHRLVWLNSFSNPGCGITRAEIHLATARKLFRQTEPALARSPGSSSSNARCTAAGRSISFRRV